MAYKTLPTTTKSRSVITAEQVCDIAITNAYCGVSVATAYAAQAVATKNTAIGIAAGCQSAAIALNEGSIAIAGTESTAVAKGVIGSFLVLIDLYTEDSVKNVVAVRVDGERIMPDVCYTLYKGCVMPAFIEERSKYPIVEISQTKTILDDKQLKLKGIPTEP